MTPSVPLIDPTPEELTALLDAASRGRVPYEVVKALMARGEGVATVTPAPGSVCGPFDVIWWVPVRRIA
jgi:hypothetical protein